MGLDRVISIHDPIPKWNDIVKRLSYAATLQMIDGELAFPDEQPPQSWHELRIGTPAGTVTLRRNPDAVVLIVWDNATPELLAFRDALADGILAASTA